MLNSLDVDGRPQDTRVVVAMSGGVDSSVPPVALTVTIELPPLHRIAVLDELATTAVGSVIVPLVVWVQLLASVTVYE